MFSTTFLPWLCPPKPSHKYTSFQFSFLGLFIKIALFFHKITFTLGSSSPIWRSLGVFIQISFHNTFFPLFLSISLNCLLCTLWLEGIQSMQNCNHSVSLTTSLSPFWRSHNNVGKINHPELLLTAFWYCQLIKVLMRRQLECSWSAKYLKV